MEKLITTFSHTIVVHSNQAFASWTLYWGTLAAVVDIESENNLTWWIKIEDYTPISLSNNVTQKYWYAIQRAMIMMVWKLSKVEPIQKFIKWYHSEKWIKNTRKWWYQTILINSENNWWIWCLKTKKAGVYTVILPKYQQTTQTSDRCELQKWHISFKCDDREKRRIKQITKKKKTDIQKEKTHCTASWWWSKEKTKCFETVLLGKEIWLHGYENKLPSC